MESAPHKPTPPDWPRLSVAVVYQDPARAIHWLCEAFGFTLRLRIENDRGAILHSELEFGEALLMVGGETAPHRPERTHLRSPRSLGGANTQSIMLFVDSADAHCERSRSRGAIVTSEPKTTDYGEDFWADRSYEAEDLEGHRWWFVERIRSSGKPPVRGTIRHGGDAE